MRYAIYFTPPEQDPLSETAATWLGRNAFTGAERRQPSVKGFDAGEIRALTQEPRRYGFHATLKAPFQLRSGRTEAELLASFEAFAGSIDSFDLPAITLGQIGAFFALVPKASSGPLQALADACVEQFEPFRAPLSEHDIARRQPEKLSETELANLHRWGYPHVFGNFRFHMTLTGKVPAERQSSMRRVLAEQFAAFIDQPLPIGHIALFVEPAAGEPFSIRTILPLRSSAERKTA